MGVVMAPLIRSEFTSSACSGRGRTGLSRRDLGWSAAALLLAPLAAAQAQERPLEIGVLAFGPRAIPMWSCGPAGGATGDLKPRQETMPYYVLGLREGLAKLNYVEAGNEKAGRAGRRVNIDVRMGSFRQLQTYAQELSRKPVDMIVAVASAAVRIAQEETRDHPIPILFPG